MSKNRNKKTPMFVSNIPTNYDFIDYTEPGEPAPSAFGNPNQLNPGQRIQTNVHQQHSPPKKSQTTNWFEQMLNNQETNSPPKNSVNTISTSRSQKIQSSTSNYGFVKPNIAVGPTISPRTGLYDQSYSTNFSKPSPGTKQNQYSIQISQPPYTAPYLNSDRNKQRNASPEYAFSSPSVEPKNYNYKVKTEQSYQTSYKSPTNFSTGYTFKEEPTYEKPKNNYQAPISSSNSSSSGFTDQSLVNSLPEPARSNILAMIKRSKGLSS